MHVSACLYAAKAADQQQVVGTDCNVLLAPHFDLTLPTSDYTTGGTQVSTITGALLPARSSQHLSAMQTDSCLPARLIQKLCTL